MKGRMKIAASGGILELSKGLRATLFLTASCILVAGCDTYSTNLRYDEPVSGRRLPNAIRVYIVRFEDKRADKRIGVALNMFDNVVTNYITGDDVGMWITTALAREMRALGYDAVVAEKDEIPGRATDAIVIDGEVAAFKCLQSTSLSVISSVVIRANLRCPNQPIYGRYYFGSEEFVLNTWVGTPEQFSRCAEKALKALMAQMVPALDARIKAYKGLEAREGPAEESQPAAPPALLIR